MMSLNFRYQIYTTKEGGSRQLLYTAGSKKEALDYLQFLITKRDFNEPLEYTIKPIVFMGTEAKSPVSHRSDEEVKA